MGLDQTLSLLTHDIAIDLGTANTRVCLAGRGIVVDEPSVVAVRGSGNRREVVAAGIEAKQMLGRTPETISAVQPVRGGIIQDYALAESLLRYFVRRALPRRGWVGPRVLVCVPCGISEVERRAVQESARASGAREVHLVHQPLAAALGAELPLQEPRGTLVCDIGGGTTEVSVLSLGGVVVDRSVSVAGEAMDRAIIEWARVRHDVLMGERSAEAVKLEVGCARADEPGAAIQVKGRDLASGIPKEITITRADAAEALDEPVGRIVEAIRATLADAPPELSSDILDSGVVLVGGGALLEGLDRVIRDASGLPVVVAQRPLRCVALGAGAMLGDPEWMARIRDQN